MRTKKDIEYHASPYGKIATIPEGVSVHPATNIPDGGYWVLPWSGMDEKAESWRRNYGFHVRVDEVEHEN